MLLLWPQRRGMPRSWYGASAGPQESDGVALGLSCIGLMPVRLPDEPALYYFCHWLCIRWAIRFYRHTQQSHAFAFFWQLTEIYATESLPKGYFTVHSVLVK